MQKKNVILSGYIAVSCTWVLLTGDWVIPSILLFAVAPAWCFSGEKGKERLKEWQKSN